MRAVSQASRTPTIIDLIGIEFDSKYAGYKRLANGILNVTCQNGVCTEQDLLPLGFSKEEITERWHMAHAMAKVELRLMRARKTYYGLGSEMSK